MAKTGTAAGVGMSGTARQAINDPKATLLARFGYATKGLVYVIIGWLALLAAIGFGGATTDRKGVITAIFQEPFGKALVAVVVVGLACFALWSFAQAALDTEGDGSKAKGIAKRLVHAAVGVSYAAFAFAALQLVLGKGSTGKNSDQNTQDWTAEFLKQPFGKWLVIIGGLIVLGVAGAQFYRAYSKKFEKHLDLSKMSANTKKFATGFGRFGLVARGLVFGIIGIFLIVAAIQQDASKAKGLGGALQEVSQQAYGQVLLGFVGLGLLAYGVFSFFEARYRRIGKA